MGGGVSNLRLRWVTGGLPPPNGGKEEEESEGKGERGGRGGGGRFPASRDWYPASVGVSGVSWGGFV